MCTCANAKNLYRLQILHCNLVDGRGDGETDDENGDYGSYDRPDNDVCGCIEHRWCTQPTPNRKCTHHVAIGHLLCALLAAQVDTLTIRNEMTVNNIVSGEATPGY